MISSRFVSDLFFNKENRFQHTIKFVTSVEDFDYDLVLEIYRTCRAMVQAVSEFVKVALKAKSQNAPAQGKVHYKFSVVHTISSTTVDRKDGGFLTSPVCLA